MIRAVINDATYDVTPSRANLQKVGAVAWSPSARNFFSRERVVIILFSLDIYFSS